MPRINLIGASNLYTNNTCEFGSMPGLPPTTGVRSWITGLNGYKYTRVAANGTIWSTGSILPKDITSLSNGCGLGKKGINGCNDGTKCLKHLNLYIGSNTLGHFKTGGRTKLLG